ncbi:General negative regulator of transcription subunit 4 [Rhodotorula toruloides]|uniref:BY PROTMAP: gi/472586601/gb/EMS24120.1/ CCR4-NOT transcription complex subunit 4 [Rhodosporidium toruloides NP11] gi/647398006/emb/CDR41542.1/ RHTO0S06e02850g1_1 [Rhodosporidium toruloides] n=1 Tax=Rhodotorula toruloides TaxID=5286 RepID=A0A0K3CBH7_RHOTO|nr:General negative regulator of transcription subunit 4 [Rhodotorula toruloides]
MRHAWSQPAHARAHPPASSSASAWSASPVPSAHLAHAAPPASAYPPLGATHADIAAASTHSNGIAQGGAGTGAGVANASTALERVLAMLDGFEDDMDCPLCLEEMDLSDLNFKPCPCGYQICRFCYHHIKENLNNRCPACRTPYDDATVEFKAIKPEEMKRLQAAKKLRDKRRKDAELAMQNKANVRVRQRTQVHITGMTSKEANEDTLAQLKDADHFGRYGTVLKLFMSKRSPSAPQQGPSHPHFQPVNVYVNYRTPSEASHCIAATDGTFSSDGNKLRAGWGMTRYCPTYLKGARCSNDNCTFAHEPGEEVEGPAPSTKDEIFTYDSEVVPKPRSATPTIQAKKQPEASLPATASWASKNAPQQPTTPIILNPHLPPLSATLPKPPPPRTISVPKPQNHPLPARPSSRSKQAKDAAAATAASSAPASSSSSDAAAKAKTSDADESAEQQPAEPVASTSRSPSPSPTPSAEVVSPPPPASNDPFAAFTLSNGFSSSFDVPTVPFPDLEFGDGPFSFSLNLDVKGKGRAVTTSSGEESTPLRDFANLESFGRPSETSEANGPFSPSALSSAASSSYMGSFDPFAENTFSLGSNDLRSGSPTPPSTAEDELSRRSSRFGFARRSSSSQQIKPMELLSAAARSAFGGNSSSGGREASPNGLTSPASTFAPPPGFGLPLRSTAFASLPPAGDNRDWQTGTGAAAPAFPPGMLRNLASPSASATSSPQLSPRTRSNLPPSQQQHPYGLPPPGLGGPLGGAANSALPPVGGAANSALPPPPGLMQGQGRSSATAIPAASFPLPPPAPRSGSGPSSTVAKEDLLALIAAAQASAPKQQQQGHQQGQDANPHPFFSDPAILNARLASTADSALPPPPGQQQQQQHAFSPFGAGGQGSPFPPGMRLPFHQHGMPQPQQQQQPGGQQGGVAQGPPPGLAGLYRPMPAGQAGKV